MDYTKIIEVIAKSGLDFPGCATFFWGNDNYNDYIELVISSINSNKKFHLYYYSSLEVVEEYFNFETTEEVVEQMKKWKEKYS